MPLETLLSCIPDVGQELFKEFEESKYNIFLLDFSLSLNSIEYTYIDLIVNNLPF